MKSLKSVEARLSVTSAPTKAMNLDKITWDACKAVADKLKASGFDAQPQILSRGVSGYVRIKGEDTYTDISLKVAKPRKYGSA